MPLISSTTKFSILKWFARLKKTW